MSGHDCRILSWRVIEITHMRSQEHNQTLLLALWAHEKLRRRFWLGFLADESLRLASLIHVNYDAVSKCLEVNDKRQWQWQW